jgi:hypothetical protein
MTSNSIGFILVIIAAVACQRVKEHNFEHPIQQIPRQPNNKPLTVQSQLELYPFLRETINPEVSAKSLNDIPLGLKSLLMLSSNLIIDGELHHYCYNIGSEYCIHGLRI